MWTAHSISIWSLLQRQMTVNTAKAGVHENIGISIHGLMDGCGCFFDTVQLQLQHEATHIAVALEIMAKQDVVCLGHICQCRNIKSREKRTKWWTASERGREKFSLKGNAMEWTNGKRRGISERWIEQVKDCREKLEEPQNRSRSMSRVRNRMQIK